MARRSKRVKKKPQLVLSGMEYDGSTALPNVRQELFCKLYASNTTPRFFGNGKQCYIFAYGHQERYDKLKAAAIGADTRTGRGQKRHVSAASKISREMESIDGSCRTEAARILTYPDVLARCNFLMDELCADKIVDRELVYVIQQRHELSSKVQAIIHYDKKKGRIIEKQESLIKFDPITSIEFVMPAVPKMGK